MTFVIISGGIDLSVGSILALGGVIAAQTVQVFWPLALILPPLLCGLIGFGNGLLIAKAKMSFFIVTLAGLLGIRGLALALAGERPIRIDGGSAFVWFGQGRYSALPCRSSSWSSPSSWAGWSSRAPATGGSSSPSAGARSRRG
jgi:ribose transport system permease protein